MLTTGKGISASLLVMGIIGKTFQYACTATTSISLLSLETAEQYSNLLF